MKRKILWAISPVAFAVLGFFKDGATSETRIGFAALGALTGFLVAHIISAFMPRDQQPPL